MFYVKIVILFRNWRICCGQKPQRQLNGAHPFLLKFITTFSEIEPAKSMLSFLFFQHSVFSICFNEYLRTISCYSKLHTSFLGQTVCDTLTQTTNHKVAVTIKNWAIFARSNFSIKIKPFCFWGKAVDAFFQKVSKSRPAWYNNGGSETDKWWLFHTLLAMPAKVTQMFLLFARKLKIRQRCWFCWLLSKVLNLEKHLHPQA